MVHRYQHRLGGCPPWLCIKMKAKHAGGFDFSINDFCPGVDLVDSIEQSLGLPRDRIFTIWIVRPRIRRGEVGDPSLSQRSFRLLLESFGADSSDRTGS